MKLIYLFAALAISALFGCAESEKKSNQSNDSALSMPDTVRTLAYVTVQVGANFEDDFRRAVDSGDVRFVGVMGYALEVPGVPDYDSKYSRLYGVKVIEGTSDMYRDSLELQRGQFYQRYAENYNRLLLRHLESR